MKKNNLKSNIRKQSTKKSRASSEIISSLLLVVVTVAGAIILNGFLGESFVEGSLAVSSSTDTTIKTIKLRSFDTRDGSDLMGYANLDNGSPTDLLLCGDSCSTNPNNSPGAGGTEFLVIQVENRGMNPIFLQRLYLENTVYFWDDATSNVSLNALAGDSSGGVYPRAGMYSILSDDITNLIQGVNEIPSGKTVNLIVKLSSSHPDIELSKTIRIQLNIGTNTLSEFLIETGGAQ